MKKEDKIVNMVFDDTQEFLLSRNNWVKYKSKGQYIAYGLLNAVFEAIFSIAPSKEAAVATPDTTIPEAVTTPIGSINCALVCLISFY